MYSYAHLFLSCESLMSKNLQVLRSGMHVMYIILTLTSEIPTHNIHILLNMCYNDICALLVGGRNAGNYISLNI